MVLTTISAIVIFLVLVLIHEFGHFIVSKLCGVKVHEFAVGMGPAIWEKQRGETLYSLRIVPIGGYCKLEGEDEASDDPRAFGSKTPLQRIAILAAGAVMNILLGFALMLVILFMPKSEVIAVPVIDTVLEDYPAAEAGLQPGDRILEVDGKKISTQLDLSFEMSRYRGGEIELVYERDGERRRTALTPKEENGMYYVGYTPQTRALTFTSRITTAYHYTCFYGKMIVVSLFDLVTGKIGTENMSGPVGIVNEIGSAAQSGLDTLLNLAALITINLGIFNLLPLPALDGGRILFVLAELITRRKIPPEKEGLVHFIGFALLLLLMVFATYNDIVRLLK